METIQGWDEPVITEMSCGCKMRMSWGTPSHIAMCDVCKKELYGNWKDRASA